MKDTTLPLKQKLEQNIEVNKMLYELDKEELLKTIEELRAFGVPELTAKKLENFIFRSLFHNGRYLINQTMLSQLTKMGIFK